MESLKDTLLKYEGFLPAADSTSASTLYRVNLQPAEAGERPLKCLVLLVDTSGSMWSAMNDLKTAIRSTVDIILDRKIASLDQIVLITFNSFSKVYLCFNDYQDFVDVVSNLDSHGCTSYSAALDELTTLLNQRGEVVAVMFSDGEPTGGDYLNSIEILKTVANDKSLLFHSIGLQVNSEAEKILRNLTTIGSAEGYYQAISGTEITASMNVLVDHFNCSVEPFINGARTRCGFIVSGEAEHFVAQISDKEISLEVVNTSFKEMLDENSFEAILEVFHFLLEYHLKSDEAANFEQATAIVAHVSSLISQVDDKISSIQREKMTACLNEKEEKMNSVGAETGASRLRQRSEIISQYNRQSRMVSEEYSELLRKIRGLKELCSQLLETLHLNHNISASICGEIMNVVSQFRDNSIALKRKHIARFSSKVREKNNDFQNIDQLLQDELDELVELESIPVPAYFQNYSDPITLDTFEDIILQKYGVFMLLVNVERHVYGITAPHRTKILEIGGFSSSVLDVMARNDSSVLFDFRGIGFGNAAVPLWINDEHWRKARHIFGPFVGHAVTGNELEYTRLQGMTLLALILIHLRQLESTEFNRHIIQMVSETLNEVIDQPKWREVASEMDNSFEKLNESVIPSAEVFLVFLEFIGVELSQEMGLLLLAEQYRRANGKRIKDAFDKLPYPSSGSSGSFLNENFPNIFAHYLTAPSSSAIKPPNARSKVIYFLNLYDGQNDSRLLKWFDIFCKKLGPSLSRLASGLEDKQKIAIILSVHKCTLYTWDAFDEVPAGLSYDSDYPNILLGWCRKIIDEKKAMPIAVGDEEDILLQILQTEDVTKAETLLRDVKRNSHIWAAMLKVLFLSIKTHQPPKITHEEWEQIQVELYQKQIESLSVPLHFQLVMLCVFDSFKPEDWVSSKMIWRPKNSIRRRIRIMFPQAPAIE